MRLSIAKHFEFEAAHQLPDQELYGKCRNLHGHTYKLTVEITGEYNPEEGWIVNFSEVKKIVKEQVIDVLDHKFLNDIIEEITTAENILFWIKERIYDRITLLAPGIDIVQMTLYETSNSFAKLQFD